MNPSCIPFYTGAKHLEWYSTGSYGLLFKYNTWLKRMLQSAVITTFGKENPFVDYFNME